MSPSAREAIPLLAICGLMSSPAVFAPVHAQPETAPATVVQRQVNAYNARDVDAFVATYAENAELFNHPNELISTGRDALLRDYAQLFAQAPNLHAEISEQMTMGDYVIARERVTGLPDGATIEAVVIYRVRHGLIDAVWFILE